MLCVTRVDFRDYIDHRLLLVLLHRFAKTLIDNRQHLHFRIVLKSNRIETNTNLIIYLFQCEIVLMFFDPRQKHLGIRIISSNICSHIILFICCQNSQFFIIFSCVLLVSVMRFWRSQAAPIYETRLIFPKSLSLFVILIRCYCLKE